MKKYLPIILIFIFCNSYATDYYFSNTGSDGDLGTSPGEAWQTAAKAQGLLDTISAGNGVYFNRGDTWNYAFSVQNVSGSVGDTLKVGAYGTGANPRFSALKTLGTWTDEGSNIWSIVDSDIAEETRTNIYYNSTYAPYYGPFGKLFINGTGYNQAREPNTGYLAATGGSDGPMSSSTTKRVFVNGVTWGSGDYADGLARIAKGQYTNFYLEPADINTNGTNTLSIWNNGFWTNTDTVNYSIKFFLSNGENMMDLNGENISIPASNEYKCYYTGNLNSQTTELSIYDSIFYIYNSSYVEVSDIEFYGGHKFGVRGQDNTGPIFMHDNKYTDIGLFALHFDGGADSLVIYNDTLTRINNEGYWITDQEVYAGITYSHLDNIGADPTGINSRRETGGCAISGEFSSCKYVFQYNNFNVVGYNGIQLVGNNLSGATDREISYNRGDSICLNISDGAFIYLYHDSTTSENKHIHHNIGTNIGVRYDYVANNASFSPLAALVYGDEGCRSLKIYDNYSNNSQFGTFFNCNQRDTVTRNIFRNVEYSTNIDHYGKGMQQTTWLGSSWLGGSQEYISMTGNYFVTLDTLSTGANVNDLSSGIDAHNSLLDTNVYINPFYSSQASAESNWAYFDDQVNYSHNYKTIGTVRTDYTAAGWEVNSEMNNNNWAFSAGWGLTKAQSMPFSYNWSSSNYEIDLLGVTVRDVYGTQHTGTATLSPYTGNVFFYESGSTSNFLNIDWENESVQATTPPEDTCDSHIITNDTTITWVPDSVMWSFEFNTNPTYGDDTIGGSLESYSNANGVCLDTWSLSESSSNLNTSSINLADTFRVGVCLTAFNNFTNAVIMSNVGDTGSGWQLQRIDTAQLSFKIRNSIGTEDSVITTGTAFTKDVVNEIEVLVNKTAGWASILIDGDYVTDTDSTFSIDFNTEGSISINGDIDGNNKPFGYHDQFFLQWAEADTTITPIDSCVMYPPTWNLRGLYLLDYIMIDK